MDLRSELERHLGSAYRLERELGGGGMSRVFVAEEVRLRRTVVVKVLSPELAQGLNVERFEREIQLAASLQQANIVPLLVAGDLDGLPWFTMPYVEGESLRVRLARGPVPVGEVVTILRDVTKALAYAHARGVVHRDIKPDNVLLSGGTAVVTDFGIAKAISASRTEGAAGATLTQLGTSIGTPAYMAPEQVAGDPGVDHRADLYSLGCMAFELLTGQQPFGDRSPQKMLAAHLTESAPAVLARRPDCPPALAALVTRLMSKDPGDRPQSAAEILPVLDSAVTTSGGGVAFSAPGMLKKALGWYALALIAVAIVAKAAVVGIGLPDWVFPGAILTMALGLPALLATAYVQRVARHTATATPTLTPGGSSIPKAPSGTMATMALKASPHLTWRRTTRGGIITISSFVLVVAAFMVLRGLGIGPWGSLFAAGKLAQDDRILVSDFAVAQGDSALGPILVEAVRAALSQSRVVRLVAPSDVAQTLLEMKRSRDTPIVPLVAREVAARVGAAAILGGRLARAGSEYAVSLDLTSTGDGATLASVQGTADGVSDLLDLLDKLTRKLRGRMGESLRQVQQAIPLEQATTASLPALRKYSEAVRANDVDFEFDHAERAAREAVALDSTFALAWRKLGVALYNARAPASSIDSALAKAAQLSDRLPDREKYLAIGAYYENSSSVADRGKALAAYQAAYAADSAGATAAHQLMIIYASRHQFDSAARYARRYSAMQPDAATRLDAAWRFAMFGQVDSSRALLDSVLLTAPGDSNGANVYLVRVQLAIQQGQLDSAEALAAAMRRLPDEVGQLDAIGLLAFQAEKRGRLAEAERLVGEYGKLQSARGGAPIFENLVSAVNDILYRGRTTAGLRALNTLLSSAEWQHASAGDRPYTKVATSFAQAGQPDRARAVLERFALEQPSRFGQPDQQVDLANARGEIALATKNYAEAIRNFRAGRIGVDGATAECAACADYGLARTFDQSGQTDSALAYFEQYLQSPAWMRRQADPYALAAVQKRLGELYDAKGDTANAMKHYAAFTGLWKDADPDLQPAVQTVKKRMGELASR